MPDLLMATAVPLAAVAMFVAGYTLVMVGRPDRVPLPHVFDRLPWDWWRKRSVLFRSVAPFLFCLGTGLVVALEIWHPNFVVRTAFVAVLLVPNIWAWHLSRVLRRTARPKS